MIIVEINHVTCLNIGIANLDFKPFKYRSRAGLITLLEEPVHALASHCNLVALLVDCSKLDAGFSVVFVDVPRYLRL